MKLTLSITCLLIVGMSLVVEGKQKPKPSEVHVISKRMDCFYFKLHKNIVGAQIEVFSEKGEKLIEKTLTQRKNLVDFYNENAGHYTIRIRKGDIQETFEFHKKSETIVPLELERVVIVTP
jgi:hypothetical protein